jgi:hypothetical protein
MDHAAAQDWLDRYVTAWLTYEADLIGDLFSEDVAYRWHPYDVPVLGRAAVVAAWLGDDTPGASSRDAMGTYDAGYPPPTPTSLGVRSPASTTTASSCASTTTDGAGSSPSTT